MEDKRCSKCGETKPLTEFRMSNGWRSNYCNDCRNKQRREHYQRTPGKRIQIVNTMRLRTYGITPEEYADLLTRQHGVCAVCHQPETRIKGSMVQQLCVDHDHVTGRVRGLLCERCNRMLGFAGDSVELLKGLIYYLESGGSDG